MSPLPSQVLVTGANGFVGSALCEALQKEGHALRRAVRGSGDAGSPRATVFVGDIGPETDWREALAGAACVVHLAARTHVMRETVANPLEEYRRVNVAGTLALAQQAAVAGVRQLVFLSSIKVNGEATVRPLTEEDAPRPEDAYGISKWEAEQALRRVAQETGLEVAILRPPLVYGHGVKGNFLRLMNIVAAGWPLPLASVHNRRSLIYVENLVDAILHCLARPEAAGQTYLVSDGEDVSTPELIRGIAAALGVRPRLLPCPVALLRLGAAALGRAGDGTRLLGSLQIDNSKIRRELGWNPPDTIAQGLAETARWYLKR